MNIYQIQKWFYSSSRHISSHYNMWFIPLRASSFATTLFQIQIQAHFVNEHKNLGLKIRKEDTNLFPSSVAYNSKPHFFPGLWTVCFDDGMHSTIYLNKGKPEYRANHLTSVLSLGILNFHDSSFSGSSFLQNIHARQRVINSIQQWEQCQSRTMRNSGLISWLLFCC